MVLPDHKVGITEQSQGCYKCKLFQKLSREELRTPVQRLTLFLAALKSFTFQKRSKKMLLHQRANHADHKQ